MGSRIKIKQHFFGEINQPTGVGMLVLLVQSFIPLLLIQGIKNQMAQWQDVGDLRVSTNYIKIVVQAYCYLRLE